MRNLVACLFLLHPALGHAADCVFREGGTPPTVTLDEGVVWFTQGIDYEFFTCAKKAGGSLTLDFLVGKGGALNLLRSRTLANANVKEGAYRSDLCDAKPPPEQLQVRVTGTGPLQRLSSTTEIVDIRDMCPRCEGMGGERRVDLKTGPKAIEVTIDLDEAWHRCALAGSTLDLRLYTGSSLEEVRAATKPAYVEHSLEKRAKAKVMIPYSKVCKGRPRYLAYDVFGTGEMKPISEIGGRASYELNCK